MSVDSELRISEDLRKTRELVTASRRALSRERIHDSDKAHFPLPCDLSYPSTSNNMIKLSPVCELSSGGGDAQNFIALFDQSHMLSCVDPDPQYAYAPCKLTIYSYLFARWHLFRHVGYLRHH